MYYADHEYCRHKSERASPGMEVLYLVPSYWCYISRGPSWTIMDFDSDKKVAGQHLENADIHEISNRKDAQDDTSSSDAIMDVEARRTAERKLVRKLDMRLVSTIILIFIMNYIDVRSVRIPRWSLTHATDWKLLADGCHHRSSEGNRARSRIDRFEWLTITACSGLKYSSDLQYDTVVAILYASYCPAQVPSNMVSIIPEVLSLLSTDYFEDPQQNIKVWYRLKSF